MPTPDGWRTETIPFPLTFAPELSYEGLEELRFSPGMFEAESVDFWSYAFIWWLPLETQLDADTLASDLEIYFRGLTQAVAKGRELELDEPKFHAQLEETPNDRKQVRLLVGQAETLDAFATQQQVQLNVSIHIWPCKSQQRLVAFFALSPQPPTHSIWQTLREIREGFRCEGSPAATD